jgi:hypothetical protein
MVNYEILDLIMEQKDVKTRESNELLEVNFEENHTL